jgi:opacity protein-like surface antigen
VRRILITCALIALALPAAAAAHVNAPDDGTLTIKNADGMITIAARGGVIGRFDSGQLWVRDPNPDDQYEEAVTGAEKKTVKDEFVTVYTGKNVRFRYIGGSFQIKVKATGVGLGVVGKGKVTLQGTDGTYSVNDSPAQLFPVLPQTFALAANSAGP